jgi:hypothetical protein
VKAVKSAWYPECSVGGGASGGDVTLAKSWSPLHEG